MESTRNSKYKYKKTEKENSINKFEMKKNHKKREKKKYARRSVI